MPRLRALLAPLVGAPRDYAALGRDTRLQPSLQPRPVQTHACNEPASTPTRACNRIHTRIHTTARCAPPVPTHTISHPSSPNPPYPPYPLKAGAASP